MTHIPWSCDLPGGNKQSSVDHMTSLVPQRCTQVARGNHDPGLLISLNKHDLSAVQICKLGGSVAAVYFGRFRGVNSATDAIVCL